MSNGPQSSEESQTRFLLLGQSDSGKRSVRDAIRFDEGTESCSKGPWGDLKTGTSKKKPAEVKILNYRCLHYDKKEKTLNVKEEIKKDMELIGPGPHVIIWVSKKTNETENKEDKKLSTAFSEGFESANDHILYVVIENKESKMYKALPKRQKADFICKTPEELEKTLLEQVDEMKTKCYGMDKLKDRLDGFIKKLETEPGTSKGHTAADTAYQWLKNKFNK
ncbi:uncharacterized protein LOC103469470 [Poecilia reticulata]|uniref:uncharacterized protein LOC103469470 n=1 Tax=Poecilia reticulata TaxID=8081 RepID=UPI0004A3FFDC|nr:PREDICTED: uncharacterized protein LOC103469470 [Poecilia reticulata]